VIPLAEAGQRGGQDDRRYCSYRRDKAMLSAKLNDTAGQLDDQIEHAPTDDDALALDEKATALRNQATELIAQAIVLRQNDIGLDATQLGNAVSHCNQVMARVADEEEDTSRHRPRHVHPRAHDRQCPEHCQSGH